MRQGAALALTSQTSLELRIGPMQHAEDPPGSCPHPPPPHWGMPLPSMHVGAQHTFSPSPFMFWMPGMPFVSGHVESAVKQKWQGEERGGV